MKFIFKYHIKSKTGIFRLRGQTWYLFDTKKDVTYTTKDLVHPTTPEFNTLCQKTRIKHAINYIGSNIPIHIFRLPSMALPYQYIIVQQDRVEEGVPSNARVVLPYAWKFKPEYIYAPYVPLHIIPLA